MDLLKKMFRMQQDFNDYCFEKNGITDNEGNILNMGRIICDAKQAKHGYNSLSNKWLGNYLTALNDESRELKDELLWKWWSKDNLDMQNIRVEIVDQLHFWMSLAMSAGLDAEDVYLLYEQKNKINLQRQNNEYSKKNKDESDNRGINL